MTTMFMVRAWKMELYESVENCAMGTEEIIIAIW